MMKRIQALALSVLSVGASGAPALCQETKSTAGTVNWSVAAPEKPSPKKKSTVRPNTALSSADTDKAARLEEGRKKFFEQSSGFDHSTVWDKSSVSGAGGGGSATPGSGSFKPGMGFNF